MRRALVIDQATQLTAYNIIEFNESAVNWLCCSKLRIRDGNSTQRSCELYSRISDLIDEYHITDLVVEEVPISRKMNLHVTEVLLKLLGMFEMLAVFKQIDIHVMNVIKWKHDAGITSKTRKEQKAESVKLALKRFPAYKDIVCQSDDVADSLNMGIAFLKQIKILK